MKTPDLEKLRTLTLDERTATPMYGRFVAEPFERGYGHTIGNALRRILLSSLEGAAISAVRVKGALHEFAVIKGVKEDVAGIILNLKKVRLKMFTPGPETIYLKVKKEGTVTAKSIEENANVEILNPEQVIATLDHGAELDIEMEVTSGRGYVLAEENKAGKHAANTITLDALYSPITKVNYEVENTRVEQITNYDSLIMEIWSDGSITPSDALIHAAKVMRNTLTIFTGPEAAPAPAEAAAAVESKQQELLDQPLSIMDLSVRSMNCLLAAGLETVNDLVTKSEEEIIAYKNCGKRSVQEIKEKLEAMGLSLAGTEGAETND